MESDPDPEYLTLVCYVQPIKLENGQPWPWTPRKRQIFKTLLRRWGLEIVDHAEQAADGPKKGKVS